MNTEPEGTGRIAPPKHQALEDAMRALGYAGFDCGAIPDEADYVPVFDNYEAQKQVIRDLFASLTAERDAAWEIIDEACHGLREPMELSDARRVREMLTHVLVEYMTGKVRAPRTPSEETA